MVTSPAQRIGSRIRELRRLHGWTQKVLAEKVYVTPAAVCQWENGKRTPDRGSQQHLAAAFNFSRSVLFAELDEDRAA